MAGNAARVIGTPKYGIGMKGGLSYVLESDSEHKITFTAFPLECHFRFGRSPLFASYNGTSTPPFGPEEQAVIDGFHRLGITHLAKFADEPRSQAEWDAWGYWLRGS